MKTMSDVCKEYGEALFSLGLEANSLDEINRDLDFINEVYEKTPQFGEFLQSPAVPKRERLETIDETFRDSVSEYALSFLSLLCEKGKALLFPECAKEFKALYTESRRISVARVTSSVPLSEEQQTKLKTKLEKISGHSVTLECLIDETLLGGVIIETDGKRFDGSLKHRLQEIKEVMDK